MNKSQKAKSRRQVQRKPSTSVCEKKQQSPSHSINGITFYPVPEFSDLDLAFGARREQFFERRSIPSIPSRFERMANDLFFSGGKLPELNSMVDRKKAFRAIQAWLCSFYPPHECKEATVGYALWLWTDTEMENKLEQ